MTWRDAAACRDEPTDWFFAEPGTLEAAAASAMCAACPVSGPCRDDARDHGDLGIRAGEEVVTVADLAVCGWCGWPFVGRGRYCSEAHRREHLLVSMPHGAARYSHLGCRCEVCTTAATARKAEWRNRSEMNTTRRDGARDERGVA